MQVAPGTTPRSLVLSVQQDGVNQWLLFLSDGDSVGHWSRLRHLPPELSSWSNSAKAGDTVAALALWSCLLPGDVGRYLLHCAPCSLALQLPRELNTLAWECAAQSERVLGQHFVVTRHLLGDRAATTGPGRPNEPPNLIKAGDWPGLRSISRQVTALSFDLVGSTQLMTLMGEESYGELMSQFYAHCLNVVTRRGGVSRDPQGDDGTMSYFGYPLAREAAVSQAVLAGLEIANSVGQLDARISVRVGIATGRVAIHKHLPFGETIHLAARLQKVADPGAVLVADSTRALLNKGFEFREKSDLPALEGIEPNRQAFYVQHAQTETPSPEPSTLTQSSPFVGRNDEFQWLQQQWGLARAGLARIVSIGGEAGIGKSRLVTEFRRWLFEQGEPSLECRCLADTQASAYFALAETLRRRLQLHWADAPDAALQKIKRGLSADMDTETAAPLLAKLLGTESSAINHRQTAQVSLEKQREHTMEVLLRWFSLEVNNQPICLVVEDLQWIDPSTREFLDRLLQQARHSPLLLLVTERGEFSSKLGRHWPDASIVLHGLPLSAARELAQNANRACLLPASILRLLVEKSDGVPLYLEESVRMALGNNPGSGLVQRSASQSTHPVDVPSSLQDLLMVRLDSLGPALWLAQVGAAIGRAFPAALLLAVNEALQDLRDPHPEQSLQALEQSGLLLRTSSAETQYRFKHALVRDTAYQSLWHRHRQQIHAATAEVMAGQFAWWGARQPEMLAWHQEKAGLTEQALAQWELAVRRAVSSSAHHEAISHVHSALALLGQQAPNGERYRCELRLQLALASRLIAIEGYGSDKVEQPYARAMALCKALGDNNALLKVTLGLQGWHFMRGKLDHAQALASDAQTLAASSHDPLQLMQTDWAVAITQFHQGQSAKAIARMDRCLSSYNTAMHRPGAVQDPGVMCWCYSAWGQWELGFADDALRRVQQVLALAHTLNHPFSLGQAHGFAASVHLFRGEIQAGLEAAERAILICEEGGFSVWLAHARVMRGRLLCAQGYVTKGLQDMREGDGLWVQTGAAVTRPMYLSLQAEGLALAGLADQGLALMHKALAMVQASGENYHEAEVRRLIGELGLQQATQKGSTPSPQELNTAQQWLQSAHDLALAQEKHSFVLRAAMGLADVFLSRDDPARAATLLASSLARIQEGQQTHDLSSAHQMMQKARSLVKMP